RVDVEAGDQLDAPDVVAAEVHVHEPRDEVGLGRVLVVIATLDEAARAVADADDRDADLLAGAMAVRGAGFGLGVRAHGCWSPPGLPALVDSSGVCRVTWTIRWIVVMVARTAMSPRVATSTVLPVAQSPLMQKRLPQSIGAGPPAAPSSSR